MLVLLLLFVVDDDDDDDHDDFVLLSIMLFMDKLIINFNIEYRTTETWRHTSYQAIVMALLTNRN